MDSSVRICFLEAVWFLQENGFKIERQDTLSSIEYKISGGTTKATLYVGPSGVVNHAKVVLRELKSRQDFSEDMMYGGVY